MGEYGGFSGNGALTYRGVEMFYITGVGGLEEFIMYSSLVQGVVQSIVYYY